jgi:hypothetical protein
MEGQMSAMKETNSGPEYTSFLAEVKERVRAA